MTPASDWIAQRFDHYVRPDVFRQAVHSDRPVWVAIGGQPGAGKTAAELHVRNLNPDVQLTPIIGDNLRKFHPDYDLLLDTDPLAMPDATAAASAAWVEASLEHARVQRYSVLVEGTFRRSEVTLHTAEMFHTAGFRTHLVALAVPPWESRLCTLERFVADHAGGRAARWTPVSAHDAGVSGTPRTLAAAAVSPHVDQVTVLNRAGVVLFDGHRPGPLLEARMVVEAEHRRPPSRVEARDWLARLASNREYLGAQVPATPETQALFTSLAVDEQRLSAVSGRGGDALRQRASRAVHVRPHAKASTVDVLEYVKTAELARTAASPVQAHLNVTPGFATALLVDEPHSALQPQLDVPDL